MTRPSGRALDALRSVSLEPSVSLHAEGSCFAKFGNTHVLCTASIDERVPGFLRNSGKGWVTAEYGMLPRSTHSRIDREAARGKQGGRTLEIQRLIGRSLRAVTNLGALGERQIKIDCDVIQADGGTRTASITGACVAVVDALRSLQVEKKIDTDPLNFLMAAISVGVYEGKPVLDLDYPEDSSAETDMNVVVAEGGKFIEIQGTAEGAPFSREESDAMLDLAVKGCQELIELQKAALNG